jgi:hypothetical protein
MEACTRNTSRCRRRITSFGLIRLFTWTHVDLNVRRLDCGHNPRLSWCLSYSPVLLMALTSKRCASLPLRRQTRVEVVLVQVATHRPVVLSRAILTFGLSSSSPSRALLDSDVLALHLAPRDSFRLRCPATSLGWASTEITPRCRTLACGNAASPLVFSRACLVVLVGISAGLVRASSHWNLFVGECMSPSVLLCF